LGLLLLLWVLLVLVAHARLQQCETETNGEDSQPAV
jgi:hypothetical protein